MKYQSALLVIAGFLISLCAPAKTKTRPRYKKGLEIVAAAFLVSITSTITNSTIRNKIALPKTCHVSESANYAMKVFSPILNQAIQMSLEDLELAVMDEFIDLPHIDVGSCTSPASLGYSLGAHRGFNSFQLISWELVSGTAQFSPDGGFMGWGDAAWGGTWVFKASFEDISCETTTSLDSHGCGMDIDKSISGSLTMKEPTIDIQMTISGTTSSIMAIGISLSDSIDFQDATFEYAELSMNVGSFGQEVVADLEAILKEAFVRNLNDNVVPKLMETLQRDLANGVELR